MPRNNRGIFFDISIPVKEVFIKQNIFVAKMAAHVLKTNRVAIVLGRTIYLHNVSARDFLKNKKWLLHELKHVEQYEQLGFLQFITKYVLFSIKYGYENNPYELAACAAEQEEALLSNYRLIY